MDHQAEEEVEVRDEVNEERHVYQDKKSPLNGGSLTQHGKQKEEHRDGYLNEDCHIRRSPPRVNTGEGWREVVIKSNHERHSGRSCQPGAQSSYSCQGKKKRGKRHDPPPTPAEIKHPIRDGLKRTCDSVDLFPRNKPKHRARAANIDKRDQWRRDVDGARQIATWILDLVAHRRGKLEAGESKGDRRPEIQLRQVREVRL